MFQRVLRNIRSPPPAALVDYIMDDGITHSLDLHTVAKERFLEAMQNVPTNSQDRRDVFHAMLTDGLDLAAAKAKVGIKELDEAALRASVAAVIAADPKTVADFKGGKTAAVNKLKGAVMKANKGVPNDVVQKLMEEELAKL